MTFYQREVISVGVKFVSILLNRRGFSLQMGIKSTKLLTSSYPVIFCSKRGAKRRLWAGPHS